MNPSDIIAECQSLGVALGIGADGKLTYRGKEEAVKRLLPTIRHHKPAIIEALAKRGQKAEPVNIEPTPATTDEPAPTSELWVTCWTPSGAPMQVRAKDADHAKWLVRMNPPPNPLDTTPRLCAHCTYHAAGCGLWWNGKPHTCQTFRPKGEPQ